jgi:hypothetical protein
LISYTCNGSGDPAPIHCSTGSHFTSNTTVRCNQRVDFHNGLRVQGNALLFYNDGWKARTNNSGADLVFEYASDYSTTLSDSNIKVHMKADGSLCAVGDVVAYASSDCRLKNNLKIISCPTDKVKALSGYEFDWNTRDQDIHKGNDVGVIAQEVEKVLPQIVCTRDTGYKAIKYEKIVPLLIEATKEQQCTIEKQQRQIDTLTCQVELLLKRCA